MSEPAESDLELEIAHVLLIDAVGYSKLLVNEQIDLLQRLNKVVRETAHFRSAEAKGKLMRLPTGDGMALLFFDSAETPLQCALEISHALKASPEIKLRMGAHSGPIKEVMDVNDRSNFAGAGINLAQRVLDCGDAGHILVSDRIAEDLKSYRHWHSCLHDLGVCEVKHGVQVHLYNLFRDGLGNPAIPSAIQGQRARWQRMRKSSKRWLAVSPWRKIALGLGTLALLGFLGVWFHAYRVAAGREKSIAVLPFANLSDEQSNAYFVDGVQDEILTDLAKAGDLKVISRTSVMQFKAGGERDLLAIARMLNVSHILEGSVQKVSNRVRVHAQLIDGTTGLHEWADQYDGELADVLGIQSEIAKRIVAQLKVHLSPDGRAALEAPPTNDFAAYDLYVRAKSSLYDSVYGPRGKDDLLEATQMLERAVARDPDFFLAYYRLAEAHDDIYQRFDPTPARRALAENALAALRRLRPESGETHHALARHYSWVLHDNQRARTELEIAQRLLPNEAEIPLSIGQLDRREGRWEDSTRTLRRALALDPQNPSTPVHIAMSDFQLRRFPEMAAMLDRALVLDPDNLALHGYRANVDLDWRADTQPLHAFVESIVNHDPAGAAKIADFWMDLAIYERDPANAARALNFLGETGCNVERIPFPRNWCEGLIAKIRGDETGARVAFTQTLAAADALVRAHPEDGGANCVLGMAHAALGHKEEAVRYGRRALELLPINRDALNGPLVIGYLAAIYAWVGENDLAIEQLTAATSVPSFWSYGNLRLHPYWDPLRDDPRFAKILESLAPARNSSPPAL